jgi:hypothetical protein
VLVSVDQLLPVVPMMVEHLREEAL